MDNGHLIEGTCICINYWKKDYGKEYIRFLTHLNSDGSSGFESDFEERIYTSPLNAWLVTNKIGVNPEYVVPLCVGDSYILYDESSKKNFSVTVVDANHNAGSVMFIFQGDFGNILYTGYFRYSMDVLQHPVLKSIIETKTMDVVYFDNTYAAEHCVFPSKEEAREEILMLISKHPDHTIIFGIENYGKEDLLFAVATHLKEQIYVSESRLQVLSQMGYEDMFTTVPEDSRILLMDIKDITINHISGLKQHLGPVLTILPSARYHTVLTISSIPFHEAEAYNIHVVPYSSHSSHSELVEFIHCVEPESVIPIIDVKYYKDLSQYLDRFWANFWKNYIVPSSIMFATSCVQSTLDLSPPDATVFNFESDDEVVTGKNKSENELMSADNKHFRNQPDVQLNTNNRITLNKKTVKYDCTSVSTVVNHSGNKETKSSLKVCVSDEDINMLDNKFEYSDDSSLTTHDSCSNEPLYLDSAKCKYESSTDKSKGFSHVGEKSHNMWNSVKNKCERSTNIDKGLLRVAEYHQTPLNDVKSMFGVKSMNMDTHLLCEAEHCQSSVRNTCDKSTNTDKALSRKIKRPSTLPSLNKPEDIDIGLLMKVYEDEKKESAWYMNGCPERHVRKNKYNKSDPNITHEVTKEKFIELNHKDMEYNNLNGHEEKTISKKCLDSFPNSSAEMCRRALFTPEHSINGNDLCESRKRKPVDSILYNKWRLNRSNVTMCLYRYERKDDDSCNIKKKKMIPRHS